MSQNSSREGEVRAPSRDLGGRFVVLHGQLRVPLLVPLAESVEEDRFVAAFTAYARAGQAEVQTVSADFTNLRPRDDVALHCGREVDRKIDRGRKIVSLP